MKGKVDSQLSLSLSDLKTGFEPVEIVAVNQCSGNGRESLNLVSRAGSWQAAPWAMPVGVGFAKGHSR